MSHKEKPVEKPEPKQDNPSGLKESDAKTDKRKPKKGLPIRNTEQK